jgi:hypothetical protein
MTPFHSTAPHQGGGGHFTAAVPAKSVDAAEAQRRVAEAVEAMPPGAARLRAGGTLGGVASGIRRALGGGGGGNQERGALPGAEAVAEVRRGGGEAGRGCACMVCERWRAMQGGWGC